MSLSTPESVQKLQTALHDKAKGSPSFRFYALYDKVYRKDVLAFAYECCKANGGAAGVDGQTFEHIEAYGTERWLDELAQELKSRTYRPLPVRRVYIPKPDGKQRPLGVPAIRDRAAEMAAVEEDTGSRQTGLRRRGENPANRHREAKVTAPLLASSCCGVELRGNILIFVIAYATFSNEEAGDRQD